MWRRSSSAGVRRGGGRGCARACFLVSVTVSRLSTVSSVWLDSRIFRYAASVSPIVLSYSLRDVTLREIESFKCDSRFVNTAKSF